MNPMDDDSFQANSPTSSNTRRYFNFDDGGMNDDTPEEVCSLCGGEPLCGGTGMVRYDVPVGDERFGKLFRCPNYRPAQNTDRQEKLLKMSNLSAMGDKSFHNFETDAPMWTPAQQAALDYALRVAQEYAQTLEGWLLLQGNYGSGKTHLAAAVGNERLNRGENVLFITSPDLLDHLRSTYSPSAEHAYDETFDRVRNADLLILDDLGVENPSGWAQEKLFQLLNHRYSRRLPTVITTNVDLDMLDPRIRSRLLDDSVIHHVKLHVPDYRTPVQNQRDRLSTLGLYSDMTFDNFDTRNNLRPEERQNLEKALELARHYADQPENWLVFIGEFGSGKTHLAAAIANAVQKRGEDVMFVTVPDLLDYLRTTFNPGSNSTFENRFQIVREAPLLVLDDLGTESATAWAKEKLFQIINHRYIARMPTVVTSARAMEDHDARLRSRLLDRRRCLCFAITAPSYVSRMYRR